MKSKFTWILLLFSVLTFQFTYAQTKVVTGIVTSKDYGDPIQGATVMVDGTTRGVDTDENGKYSINAEQGQRLIVQFLGLKTQKATVGASNVLNFSLATDEDIILDEMVFDTYRTTSKPKSNVAASTVTSKTIEGRPNASFVQTLQAQVPGLNISTGSGQPGSNNTTVILRGAGSINGNIEPLYVIDGVPMSSDNFRSINQNDIENISVLKDAGATSIYGNRGANGVIVVTTKSGSFDQSLTIKYVGNTGVSTLQKNNYDLMNGTELRAFENEVYKLTNKQKGRIWNSTQIKNAPNTDWLDYFFKPAITQSHTLSFNAGSKTLSSFTSVGYTDQEGILKNTGLKRFNFRTNLNGKSKDSRLNYGTSLTGNYSKSKLATNLGTGDINQNFVIGGLQGLPYLSPEDYPGDGAGMVEYYRNSRGLSSTPLMLMDKAKYFKYQQNEFKMIVQGNLSYKLTESLTAGTSVGVDYTTVNSSMYDDPASFNSVLFGSASTGQEYNGFQSESYSTVFSFNSTSYLKWAKSYGLHSINAGVYLEYLKAHNKASSLNQEGLHPYFATPGGGTGWIPYSTDNEFYVPSISQSRATAGLFSYFGNVDYDYNTRYGVGVTVRRDASFRFADSNRWGTFYSVSARWNISNEKFMENATAVTDLKLRGSYGTAGNQDIMGTGLFGGANLYQTLYGFGRGYNNEPSLMLTQLPNPDLKWETITQSNIGLDFGLWENRLRGTIDVYQKKTTDLYQTKPISAINGTTGLSANIGSLRNRGVELLLAADVIKNDNLKLTLNVNGSYNKNELLDIPSEDGIIWNGGTQIMREGDMLYQYFVYKYAGVNPANGNLWFYDKDGNTTEKPTDDDRVYTNKSPLPVYQGGFGFDVDYKGFFLSTQFSYALKVYRFDSDYSNLMGTDDIGIFNKSKDLYNSWTESNRNTDVPGYLANNTFYDAYSDRFLKDASYVRLRYVTLGYSFPTKNLAPLKLSGLRIYGQAENLITWTKWKGFDAESNRAQDFSSYPTPKTISFGVEVQF